MLVSGVQRRLDPSCHVSIEPASASSPERHRLEGAVVRRFESAFGADVKVFLCWLLGIVTGQDRVLGVIGAQNASGSRLFLERYLDRPVEESMPAAGVESVPRDAIWEVGNLADVVPGIGLVLVTTMAAFLAARHARFAVFTATHRLRRTFARAGIELVDLGGASASRLPAPERARWGDYYDQAPRVMTARIDQIQAATGFLARSPDVLRLWREAEARAHAQGLAS